MALINSPSAYHTPVPELNNEATKQKNAYDMRIVLDAGAKLQESQKFLSEFQDNLKNDLVDHPEVKTPKERLLHAENTLKLDKAKTLMFEVIKDLRGLKLPQGIFDIVLLKNNQKKWEVVLNEFEASIKNENDPQRLIGVLNYFLDINQRLIVESHKLSNSDKTSSVNVRGEKAQTNVENTVIGNSVKVETAKSVLQGPVEAIEWQGVVFGESVTVLERSLKTALIAMTQKKDALYGQVYHITQQIKLIAQLKFEKIQLEQTLKKNELELKNFNNPTNEEKITASGKKEPKTDLEQKSIDLNKKISEKAQQITQQDNVLKKLNEDLPKFESDYKNSGSNYDAANEALKKEKLEIVSTHRNALADRLDGQITINKGELEGLQNSVVTINAELVTIQKKIDDLLQRQSENAAEFTAADEKSLTDNQKTRTQKVVEKLSDINTWMDKYVKSIVSMQQKYYNETQVNKEVRAPLTNKLKVITDELELIDNSIVSYRGLIKGIDDSILKKDQKSTNPLVIGEISKLEEEAIGYDNQIKYLEQRAKEQLMPKKNEVEKQIQQVDNTQNALTTSVVYLQEKATNLLLQINYKIIDSDWSFSKDQQKKLVSNLEGIAKTIDTNGATIADLQNKIEKETDRSKKNGLREKVATLSTDQLKLLQTAMQSQKGELETRIDTLVSDKGAASSLSTGSKSKLTTFGATLDSQWTIASQSTEFAPKIIKSSELVKDPTKIPQTLVIEQKPNLNPTEQK